jgi:hypothetical protein
MIVFFNLLLDGLFMIRAFGINIANSCSWLMNILTKRSWYVMHFLVQVCRLLYFLCSLFNGRWCIVVVQDGVVMSIPNNIVCLFYFRPLCHKKMYCPKLLILSMWQILIHGMCWDETWYLALCHLMYNFVVLVANAVAHSSIALNRIELICEKS